MGISTAEARNLASILAQAKDVFEASPGHINLPALRPLLFLSDLHGDAHLMYHIHTSYEKSHHLVWLGDYVDRSPKDQPQGSFQCATYLLSAITENPTGITLLKGDHELFSINLVHGFLGELNNARIGHRLADFNDVFKYLPLSARTTNGVIALHGGLPEIESKGEFETLPHQIEEFSDDIRVSQLLTNDHIHDGLQLSSDQTTELDRLGCIANPAREAPGCLLYGQSHFDRVMSVLGGKFLLRGHDARAPITALNKRAVTINTASHMTNRPYGIIVDPQKELRTFEDLKVIYF